MFIKTKEILESSESALLGFSTNRSLLKPIQRFFLYPFAYLKMGFCDFAKPIATWSFMSLIVFVIFLLLSSSMTIHRDSFSMFFNIFTFVLLALTIFLPPSTYAFYGATEITISTIVKILDKYGVQSDSSIALLESNLERVEQRIEARVKFYKWIIGAFWGVFLFSFNLQLRFLSLSDKKIDETFLNSSFQYFLLFILCTVVALLLMISYKRASNMLIANLQYACIEQKSRQSIT